MCVGDLQTDVYTDLNVSGFGWKIVNRMRTGGLHPQVGLGKYHEYKWNIAKKGSNSCDYDRGFHIPLTNKELIELELEDITYCIKQRYTIYPVLLYVEYKDGHTLGEDYGPCIVANKMRVIDMYVLENNELVKLKKGLGKNWLKDISNV
jgi:hypothetical protein